MRILVLGGTVFVGRHTVELALERGHEVSMFNRGQSNPGLFQGIDEIRGDRQKDLDRLAGRSWDAVIDTSGYLPRIVGASARALAESVPHYTFISSISAYARLSEPGMDEDAPLGELSAAGSEDIGKDYGALKVLCEQEVQAAYPAGALIIRPGLIVGPHDPTDRFTYWPVRAAEGGEVLAPGDPGRPVQVIDARDLAAWNLDLVERGVTGVFNATGPVTRMTMGRMLEACREGIGSDATFTWLDEAFLLEAARRRSIVSRSRCSASYRDRCTSSMAKRSFAGVMAPAAAATSSGVSARS
jgi:2'-hydroxyisoflavone reductase